MDPKWDHGLAHGRPGMVQSGFGPFLGPGWTWLASEVWEKVSRGPVFGLSAMAKAELRQLNPKRDHMVKSSLELKNSLINFLAWANFGELRGPIACLAAVHPGTLGSLFYSFLGTG